MLQSIKNESVNLDAASAKSLKLPMEGQTGSGAT